MRELFLIGTDYRHLDLAERESLFPGKTKLRSLIREHGGRNSGSVILATCNRFELYSEKENPDLTAALRLLHIGKAHLYRHTGIDVIKHLAQVMAGLHAQAIGETHIINQIKEAEEEARLAGSLTKGLVRMLGDARFLSKKIRRRLGLNKFDLQPELEHFAIQRAIEHFGNIENRTAVILGAGEVGESTARLLLKCHMKRILMLCRRPEKYSDLAEKLHVEVWPWARLHESVCAGDLLISATSAPHYVIRKDEIHDAISDNRERLFIDLAVPRDIDPDVKDLPGVQLLNIEDLPSGTDELRTRLLESAAKILHERNRCYEHVSVEAGYAR